MQVSYEQFLIFYFGYQIFSALVQALPEPNGNVWYTFFYKFMSLLIADFKSFSAQMPAAPALTVTQK
jgi:hypothetical protein